MQPDDNEFVSFCNICSQEQTIDADKAPIEYIYLNTVEKIPQRAQAAFASKAPSILKEWYSAFLKLKYTYFVSLRNLKNDNPDNDSNFIGNYLRITIDNENWKSVLDEWKKQESLEATVYILRIHQVQQSIVNSEFYNTFREFNTWVNYVTKSVPILANDFEFMESHFSVFNSATSIDFQKVSDAITHVTRDIVSNNTLSEKGVIKSFTKSIVDLFECEICDYLRVDKDVIRIYATSFEPQNNNDFESQLENSEHYDRGEGISGAIMLGDYNDPFFHVGTNCLLKDGRQSPWHTNAYSKFYQEDNLHDFWVFPLYSGNDLVAAFRVINKVNKTPWNYNERLQLLYLAKWFQEFFLLCQKYTQEAIPTNVCQQPAKFAITEKILVECLDNDNPWITQTKLDDVILHLTQTVHRRIEKKQIGCCMVICSSKDIDHLCSKSRYNDYVIFDNSENTIKKINTADIPLDIAAESYSIIYPTSGAFIWNENLRFTGVKSLGNTPLDKETKDNALIDITRAYSNSLVFLLERGQNSILIYHDGKLKYEFYLSDYDGGWHIRSYQELLDTIKKALRIMAQKGTKINTYEDIFDAIWWMSYRKIGTMIVITKPEKIATLKESSEQGREIGKPFSTLKSNMIYDLAMVDGAMLMGEDGLVKYGGVHFTFANELPRAMDTELRQKGLRHHQAGHIVCGDDETLVFTVSENRGIGAFYKKKVIFLDR